MVRPARGRGKENLKPYLKLRDAALFGSPGQIRPLEFAECGSRIPNRAGASDQGAATISD